MRKQNHRNRIELRQSCPGSEKSEARGGSLSLGERVKYRGGKGGSRGREQGKCWVVLRALPIFLGGSFRVRILIFSFPGVSLSMSVYQNEVGHFQP